MRPLRPFIAVGLLLGAACATPSGSEPHVSVSEPSARPKNASDWLELQSEHFTLTTDHDARTAQAILTRLEVLRSALLASAWGKAKVTGDRTEVYVLRTHDELTEFGHENLGGFTQWRGSQKRIVSAGKGIWAEQVLLHELVHTLSRHLLPNQPVWFSEGLAGYLQTLKVPDDASYAEMGDADLTLMQQLAQHGRVPSEQILTYAYGNDMGRADLESFYASAWLLTHYLNNARTLDFRKYQLLLARGVARDTAWREAFPDLTPKGLDEALTLYLRYGQFHVLRVDLQPVSVTVKSRALSQEEAHALRAMLFLNAPSNRDGAESQKLAKAEIAPYVNADPPSPAVLEVELQWTLPSNLVEPARKAAQAHPDDAKAWELLAALLAKDADKRAERLEALGKAAALRPTDANTLNSWAWELTAQGRASDALAPARKSVELEPDAANVDTLAVTLASLGKCNEALADEQLAISLLRPEASTLSRRQYFSRLEEIKSGCHAAEPASAPAPKTTPAK